ncbi:MAG: hypothetical protein JJE55_13715 [Flavobacteriaceae bacterium]|nr:hypothetical protein [Flavobacteriaceae bacterium]
MKYIKLLFIFLIISQTGCKTHKQKSDLLGIWESIESHQTKNVMTFYQDSLVLDGFSGDFHTNSEWNMDDSNIYLKNVRLMDTILKKKLTYKYVLNPSKDTLWIKYKIEKGYGSTRLKKVEKNLFIIQ